jgi:hypothetical protein
VTMLPVVFEPWEKVVAGNHQYTAGFEALLKFFTGNRQAFKPQP